MFPSPVGESYFSMVTVYPCSSCSHNFRPLSGNLIFQSDQIINNAKEQERFPSPVGESYFSMKERKDVQKAVVFPSPVGESYFSIGRPQRFAPVVLVSVPCRGILFFNENILWKNYLKLMFPSPVGESYFSM